MNKHTVALPVSQPLVVTDRDHISVAHRPTDPRHVLIGVLADLSRAKDALDDTYRLHLSQASDDCQCRACQTLDRLEDLISFAARSLDELPEGWHPSDHNGEACPAEDLIAVRVRQRGTTKAEVVHIREAVEHAERRQYGSVKHTAAEIRGYILAGAYHCGGYGGYEYQLVMDEEGGAS